MNLFENMEIINLDDYSPTNPYPLVCEMNDITFTLPNDTTYKTFVINCPSYGPKLLGPTFKISKGKDANILVQNKFPPIKDHVDHSNMKYFEHNWFHYNNHVNLHLHGGNAYPCGRHDNVMISIPPNKQFRYQISISENTWIGTNFYHPHNHGTITQQIQGGMGGLFIIGNVNEESENHLIIQEISFTEKEDGRNEIIYPCIYSHIINKYMGKPDEKVDGSTPENKVKKNLIITLNGKISPIIKMKSGETRYWRICNACALLFLDIDIIDEFGNEAGLIDFSIVSIDGNILDKPISKSEIKNHIAISYYCKGKFLMSLIV